MSDKIKKFDGGGGIDGSGPTYAPTSYGVAGGGMNFGGAFNSMLGGSSALGGVGFDSGGTDSDNSDAELDPGLDPFDSRPKGLFDADGNYIAPANFPGGQDAYNKMLADTLIAESVAIQNNRNAIFAANDMAELREMLGGDATQAGDNSLAMGMAQSQQNPGAAIPGGLGSLNPSGGFTIPTGPLGPILAKGQDALNAVGRKVGDAIDEVFRILRLPNPTKIIGAPNQKTGTIVWGQSGGNPAINTGTTGAGTQTIMTTGNAALDAVLNKVTGVATGRIAAGEALSTPTITEILVATAAQETGLSTENIEELIESAQTVADATLNVAQDGVDPNKVGIDLTGGPDVGGDTTDVLGSDGAAPELKATADAVDVVGAADVDVITNPADVVDVAVPELKAVTDVAPELKAVTGPMSDAELDDILTGLGGLPAVDGGYDTPAPELKASTPDLKTSVGPGGSGSTGVVPEQIIGQGSMGTISTEKAGLAEINAQYNPALSLAENMAILRGARSKEEDIVDSAIYYGGGMIQNTDMTDEINRLLRGY